MSDTARRSHWENVYTTKGEEEVSWYEASPVHSLSLLRGAGLTAEMDVIDVGAGASRLVDALLGVGQAHVTVLDISAAALDTARARLGDPDRVTWVVKDVTEWQPDRRYDFWHDRAVLHFLTAPADQTAYARVMTAALKDGGRAVIGTFAPDGPEKCSGLAVVRHDADSLRALFGDRFALVSTGLHDHRTPWGSVQKFQFSVFEKVGP